MKRFVQMTAIAFFSILAVACACHCPPRSEAVFPAAAMPPAGLLPEQAPQFIVFGSDDNGSSGLEGSGAAGGLHFLTELFSGLRNPAGSGNALTFDGTVPHYSYYVNTYYISPAGGKAAYESGEMENPAYVRRAWKEALDNGHELGVHTHSHPHGKEFSSRQWRDEIQRCIDILGRPYAPGGESGLGVERGRLAGFRTPFLEYNDHTLEAARDLGFLYDCSLEEGTQPEQDGSNFLWPYRLDFGSPGNFPLIGRHPGLWEIPVYVFIVPPDGECERYGVAPGLRAALQQRQNYFDPAAGKITGMDWNLWCRIRHDPGRIPGHAEIHAGPAPERQPLPADRRPAQRAVFRPPGHQGTERHGGRAPRRPAGMVRLHPAAAPGAHRRPQGASELAAAPRAPRPPAPTAGLPQKNADRSQDL